MSANKLDKVFLSIFNDFQKMILGHARQSTEFILDISENYLDSKARTAVNDFYKMYFSDSGKIQESSEEINAEVDDLFDEIQGIIESEGSAGLESLKERDVDREKRLSLSGLQKQLEMLVSLDAGIKEKLVPVLHSMQFEDALRQRLDHIKKMWFLAFQDFAWREDSEKLQDLATKMSNLTSSVAEREVFCKHVLRRELKDTEQDTGKSTLKDFLF